MRHAFIVVFTTILVSWALPAASQPVKLRFEPLITHLTVGETAQVPPLEQSEMVLG